MSKLQYDLTIIAGISGVGKTFIINKILNSDNKYIHFSAGELIKKRKENLSHDELRLLSSNEILRNQRLLIDQLNIEKSSICHNKHILFDAHMLIDTDKELVEIPLDIFEKLSPSRIVFLHEEPETIMKRRSTDLSRKRPIKTLEELQFQQDRSRILAMQYSNDLSIDFISHASIDKITLAEKIK